MRKYIATLLCALLVTCQGATAMAAYIPTDVIRDDNDGKYTITKIYTLPTNDDPEQLIEEPFEQDGLTYSYYEIVKEDQSLTTTKNHEELVSVSTESKDIEDLLPLFAPSMTFEEDGYSGTLYLDHTSISAEATGYSSRSYQVTETKEIGPLTRNDPSYVPSTTIKDGRTLSLVSVDWSVQGTSLVGDTLIPSSYMATAYYSTTVSYSAADGYTATARYTGELTENKIDQVTYTVVYQGTPIVVEPESEPLIDPAMLSWLIIAGILLLLLGIAYAIYVAFFRRNVKVYALAADDVEYELITKAYLDRKHCNIDVGKVDAGTREAVIEIQKRAASNLFGKTITVIFGEGQHAHRIKRFNEETYCYTASIPLPAEEVTTE